MDGLTRYDELDYYYWVIQIPRGDILASTYDAVRFRLPNSKIKSIHRVK
jgi:hypothetical protein